MSLSTISTLAHSVKPPTKAEAFRVILDAIAQGDMALVPPATQALLYAYFLPKVPKVPKTPEQWVMLAVSRNDVRYYLNYLYSDGTTLAASDGHRIHVCPTTLAAGYYDTALTPIPDMADVKYPDFTNIVAPSNRAPIELDLATCPVRHITKNIHAYIPPGTETGLNVGYLSQAAAGLTNVTLQPAGLGGYRLEHADGRYAVIMPIRL